MRPGIIRLVAAFMAVFLYLNSASATPGWQPLVFSKRAPDIARAFGEKEPEKVLIVVVTKAPDETAYVVVIMKNGHKFKWTRGPYAAAIKRIQAVIAKPVRQTQVPGKYEL
jgi:hypothetical protein